MGSAACGMTNQYKVFALYWNGGSFTEGMIPASMITSIMFRMSTGCVRSTLLACSEYGRKLLWWSERLGASPHAQSGYSGSVRLDWFARTDSVGMGALYGSGNASPLRPGLSMPVHMEVVAVKGLTKF
jgi:hypothetical protein